MTMPGALAVCAGAWMLVLGGCASAPRQSMDIATTPPGATVYRIDGASIQVPGGLAGPVTPTAATSAEHRREIGRTPLHVDSTGEAAFRLRVELQSHEPYEVAIPGKEVVARISVGLVPTGDLRDEDALLDLLLDRGPLPEDDFARLTRAAMTATRTAAALSRLEKKGALDIVKKSPPTYDLGEPGVARLRERLGEAAVIVRLLESRRGAWRAGSRP